MKNRQPVESLKGIGEKTAALFEKIGVFTVDDLLHYYPRDYDTFGEPKAIGELSENRIEAVDGYLKSGAAGRVRERAFHRFGRNFRHDRQTPADLVSHAIFKKYVKTGKPFYLSGESCQKEKRPDHGTAADVPAGSV